MIARRDNLLPGIRGIINGMEGKNYAFDDCMAFLMERFGEKPELDYWAFTGITGDGFTMVYNKNATTVCEYCVSGYLAGAEYTGYVFDAVGYGHTYAAAERINADKTMYLRKLMDYIDRGIPVIVRTRMADTPEFCSDVGTHFLYVGYEDYGNTLLFLYENKAKLHKFDTTGEIRQDWIFAGGKKRDIPMAEICRDAVMKIPYWLTLPEREGMLFGAAAFRAWAEDIENGRYDNEEDLWGNYSVYICNMATNSRGVPMLLFDTAFPQYRDAREEIARQYSRMGDWEGEIWRALEDLGGGFNVSTQVLRDTNKRMKIAAKIREAAGCVDRALDVLKKSFR